jgi:3'-phosphoadenosine 5'-phosphosulfate sulfotransferase (PAPS reductase)/FAD synthetase
MKFNEVIKTYGYPLLSKEISRCVQYAKVARAENRVTTDLLKIRGEFKDHFGDKSKYNKEKYAPLMDVDFNLSAQCCDVMKKKPLKDYSKKSGKKPMTAEMAVESDQRESQWQKNGCNGFKMKVPKSTPMVFWTEQDVLRYIYENDIEICSVYGNVTHDGEQLRLDGKWETTFRTTGCSRTGCVFCGFGAHLYEEPPRFLLLKEIDRKKYEYCMGGGEFVNGIWQPNKGGLGMRYVLNRLNELYGDGFIKF